MTERKIKTRIHKAVFDMVAARELDYTRPEVQRNIEQYGVYCNGELVTSRLAWITHNDLLSIDHWPARSHGNIEGISVVHENEYHYVFFKPAGVVIEAGAGHQRDNLVQWMTEHFPQQTRTPGLNEDTKYGLVHRLDKDTQGLVLVAKTLESYVYYKQLFKQRTITKKYLTCMSGNLDQNYHLTTYNVRDDHNPTRQKAFLSEADARLYNSRYREAVSGFKPLVYCSESNQTLVEVTLFTGRMHQIRLQAEVLGHPLVGDTKYTKSEQYKLKSYLDTSPQQVGVLATITQFEDLRTTLFESNSFDLLAYCLEFTDISGKYQIIHSVDLAALLSTLV